MDIVELIDDILSKGVKLWVENGQLRYLCPKGSLTAEKLAELRQYKEKIIAHISAKHTTYPLSEGQKALWFINKLAPKSPAYNIAFALRIRSPVDISAMRRSFQRLIERHPCLRTTFSEINGVPIQKIHEYKEVSFQQIDSSGWNDVELFKQIRSAYQRPFDLENGSLMRIDLFTHSQNDHVILWTMHHIISDAWSLWLLSSELSQIYPAENQGQRISLPLPQLSYSDYVQTESKMLESPESERLWAYWKQQLSGELPVLNLPADHIRPAIKSYNGASVAFNIDIALTQKLKNLSQQYGVTLFMTLLSAFYLLLYRYTGQEDIIIGSPVAGRHRAEWSGIVGYFVNMVVLRADLSDNPPFCNFLQKVFRIVIEAMKHQAYPFSVLVQKLNPDRNSSYTPLIQASFVFQKPQESGTISLLTGTSTWCGLQVEPYELPQQEGQTDIELEIFEIEKSCTGSFKYNIDIFEKDTISRMTGNFLDILENIVENPDRKIGIMKKMMNYECKMMKQMMNDECRMMKQNIHKSSFINHHSSFASFIIHHLFEKQVECTPDAIAVSENDECRMMNDENEIPDSSFIIHHSSFTYQELNTRANQLAHYLISIGVEPEIRCGIFIERSVEMIVGILGILKAGGAYVPLDPNYPQQRIAFTLENANAPVIVTQHYLKERLGKIAAKIVCIDTDWKKITKEKDTNPETAVLPDNLAYVIYTSGSTGKPKGVMINHQNVTRLFDSTKSWFNFNEHDVWTLFHSYAFDFSVWEIWGALLFGGRLVIVPYAVSRCFEDFYKLLCREGVTILNQTPSSFKQLIQTEEEMNFSKKDLINTLRLVIFGGEALDIRSLKPWFDRHGDKPRLINMYGITETTVHVTYREISTADCLAPTKKDSIKRTGSRIGIPIPDLQIYILDNHLQPLPIGVQGEIYVSGAGLCRGYLNQPDLTADRFIPNPFDFKPGSRLYKTGDLARQTPDGDIEYLGRIDHQVKIRGFRIELGEIESVLSEHPTVQECVVLKTEEDRLVAYVVLKEMMNDECRMMKQDIHHSSFIIHHSHNSHHSSFIIHHLKSKLPDYMIPSAFVFLDDFPLTSNGKIDRNALPMPEPAGKIEGYTAPRNPTEDIIASIWAEVLNIKQIGVNDNFFEAGGHSLLAMQIISRMRSAFCVEFPVRCMFEYPTVRELSQYVEAERYKKAVMPKLHFGNPIKPVSRSENLRLSFSQQRLWFLDKLEGKTAAYNIPALIRLTGILDIPALEKALNQIIRRHEILRTTFSEQLLYIGKDTPEPVQMILPDLTISLPIQDAPTEDLLMRLAESEAGTPFDLSKGPLIRAKLFRIKKDVHVLCIVMHHIISDGWSIGIFIRELAVLHSFPRWSVGTRIIPPFGGRRGEFVQYADFANWQREYMTSAVLEEQLGYWKKQLAGIPAMLELPTDRPRPAFQTFNGNSRSFILNVELTEALKYISRKFGATLFMTLYAAFATLLFRYTGQEDIVIGTPTAGRNHKDIESVIGFFVNNLVLRTNMSGNPTFKALLEQVRQITLDAHTYQDIPFEKLVDELQPERSLSRHPLFQVMFDFQNADMKIPEIPGLTIDLIEIEHKISTFDLTLSMRQNSDFITSWIEYNTDMFDSSTIDRMIGNFQTMLEGIAENPEQKISDIPILTQSELRQFAEWNDTKADYPDICVHQLFEACAENTPDAVAVICEDKSLTYRQLNDSANQLANHLKSIGVVQETPVGIFMDRSIEMIISMLGILKAGGAYVPLDPDYPQERLNFMIADCGLKWSVVSDHKESGQLSVVSDQKKSGQWSVVSDQKESGQLSVVSCQKSTELASYTYSTSPTTDHLFTDHCSPTTDHYPLTTDHLFTDHCSLAYILYTSGSTGYPKGVAVDHKSLLDYVITFINTFNISQHDRVLQQSSISFDASIEEIFPALCCSASVVICRNPKELDTLFSDIIKHNITLLSLSPGVVSYLNTRAEELPKTVRLIISGGDVLYSSFIDRLHEKVKIYNTYGPTETTVCRTYHEVVSGQWSVVSNQLPIGKPIANTQIFIMDKHMNLVPVGVKGELYIGGAGVAKGYINHPDLTAEKFVPNPLSLKKEMLKAGSRLYKTGDLAKYLPDGSIEFIGRIDNQVKIRGFRIELGEIEAVLAQHPSVKQCAVLKSDEDKLVAYVVLKKMRNDECRMMKKDIHHLSFIIPHLKSKLPDYMIPSSFIFLDNFPLTPTGKIEHKKLTDYVPAAYDRNEYDIPKTATEKTVANVWSEVLKRPYIGINDNFFELGGHSLLAVQVVSRLREIFQIELPVRSLFEWHSVYLLSSHIETVIKMLKKQMNFSSEPRQDSEEEIVI